MRRAVLLTMSTLGLIVCLVGSTGLFAALTDTADLGPNNVDAAGLPGSADLQLAYRVPDPENANATICGTYQEDLTTEFFIDANDFATGSTATNMVCMRNVGSQTVDVVATAIGVTDADTTCTGDEADLGDATCGGGAQGELSNVLQAVFYPTDCATLAAQGGGVAAMLDDLVGTPLDITASGLAPAADLCFEILIAEPGGTPAIDRQLAQSDSVSWTFRFTGTAGS